MRVGYEALDEEGKDIMSGRGDEVFAKAEKKVARFLFKDYEAAIELFGQAAGAYRRADDCTSTYGAWPPWPSLYMGRACSSGSDMCAVQ